ncbi:MAG: hypothetical protein D5R97_05550 [Candidatus Syntrophonatronum acetioxidans]|uniref:DUF4911 domain-containing protein n=1 Tax=Candidatus Syntrophonatronum acetioxidans TaxID=1795816 RepID=A0A424YE74_9FIRM|nr:MAG: hypothetical protein D5R97_05550 [Candidatus Syntrophonatronum acetioxidans]
MHKNFTKGLNPDSFSWKIRVETAAHIDSWMADCFNGLNIEHRDKGTTVITGFLADLPAVYGLILQMRDRGVELLSMEVRKESKLGRYLPEGGENRR